MYAYQEIFDQCTNVLPTRLTPKSMKMLFQELADALTGDEYPDVYGEGDDTAAFEAEIAELFGKEAAVFMPSGTMAQQIALRIWCERGHNFTAAMHPTAHPEWAEHAGYLFLHNIRRLQFGAPEYLRERMFTAEDLESLGQKPGVILLELPYRPLGGELPAWEELLAIREWADAHAVPLHMDGARIWQCRPFYQKSYAEIAALFDSVYISFYKDLGGLAGAALLGPADFIKEAHIWQKRHGGKLRTLAPLVVSARVGLRRAEPLIDQCVQKAREIAGILNQFDRIAIRPDPPHVNFFQVYVQGDPETLTERHMELARETGTFVFSRFYPTFVPGMTITGVMVSPDGLDFDTTALRPFIEQLLDQP